MVILHTHKFTCTAQTYAHAPQVDGVNLDHEPQSSERIIQYTRIPISTTDCPSKFVHSNI